MKITLSYNASVTFNVDPRDVVDMLNEDASPEDIRQACRESIDYEAQQRWPGYTTHGIAELIAEVTRRHAASRTEGDRQ